MTQSVNPWGEPPPKEVKLTFLQVVLRWAFYGLIGFLLIGLFAPKPPKNPQDAFATYQSLGIVSKDAAYEDTINLGREAAEELYDPQRR